MRHSSFSLAAEGGVVLLVSATALVSDFTSTSIVDKLGYGTATIAEGQPAPAPSANQAIERKPGGNDGNGTDTDNNAQDFILTASHPRSRSSPPAPALPTPPPEDPPPQSPPAQQETPQNAPAPAEGTVVLNEIYSDPSEGEREWVEIFSSSATPIALDGATIEDAKGVIATLTGSIGSATPFVVATIASARLNNGGDAVILKWRDGTILDRMAYGNEDDGNPTDNAPAPPKSSTLVRYPDGTRAATDVLAWRVTGTPTKELTNQLSTPPSPPPAIGGSSQQATESSPLASVGSVRVNEFVADPQDNDVEWVEIVNAAEQPISLAGWVIEEGGGEQTPLSGVIGTDEFDRYVVVKNPKGALNNGGDRIIIKDAEKRTIDDVAYGSWTNTPTANAPTAPDPWAVARIPGSVTGRSAKDFAVTTTPTPKAANRITSPSGGIIAALSGQPPTAGAATNSTVASPPTQNLPPAVILDAPDNATVNESIIFDASDSDDPEGKPLTFTWEIEGNRVETSSADTLAHTFTRPGKYALRLSISDGTHTTRLRHRITVTAAETKKPKNGETKKQSAKSESASGGKSGMMTIEGVVNAPFGIVSTRRFALANVGIVNVTHGDLPTLAVGQRVRIRGKRNDEAREVRLSVASTDDIVSLGVAEPPKSTATTIRDIEDITIGSLIHLTGEVESVRGKNVTMSDDGEMITVTLTTPTKLSASLFVEGDTIAVTGILGKSATGFRVLPRQSEDVEWLARAPASSPINQPQPASGLVSALTTAALTGTLFGLWKLIGRRAATPVSFTAPPADDQSGDAAKPRPLHHDGTLPEEEEGSKKQEEFRNP